MNKLYSAHLGKELICVGVDPDHLNHGIEMWNSGNPQGYKPQITVTKQPYTIHPKWLDMAWYASVKARMDTR